MAYVVAGVDPGFEGAVCFLSADGALCPVFDMPLSASGEEVDSLRLYEIFGIPVSRVFVEKVGAFPKGSRSSAFTFGRNYESVLSALKIRRVSYDLVRPQDWKAEVLRGVGKTKSDTIDWCRRNFPTVDLLGPGGKVRDGRADALGIAEYGRRLVGRKE